MAASASGGGGGDPLSAEAAAALGEGVGLVFGRWTALQMALENHWGSRDSKAKADQLGASILSWFGHSKGPHYFEDLVDMMYDTISESLNADFDDGSVEEVVEQLLIMHEECQQRNYSSVEKLRNSHVQGNAVSRSRQLPVGGDDDSDSSDDDDDASMMDDEAAAPEGMAVHKPKPSKPAPDVDGWTVVPRDTTVLRPTMKPHDTMAPLSAEAAAAALGEVVGLVLGRWTALQIAVENQWGGRESKAKADQLGASILSWFGHSKGLHNFGGLVDMMYDTISESFNADFEDGSVEEVAEQLFIIYEEWQQRNF